MKKRIIQILSPLLGKCGLTLLRSKEYQRSCTRESLLIKLINERQSREVPPGPVCPAFIIFSKDRALQLHGLLKSLLCHVTGDYDLNVLYQASTSKHQAAYDEVQKNFTVETTNTTIQWSKEQCFRDDLIQVLGECRRGTVCFLVDDIVFIRNTDLEAIHWTNYSKGILSLRLGPHITKSYTKGRTIQPPNLMPADGPDPILQFSWTESDCEWTYPLSLDGHFLPAHEIRVALKELQYSAPNSLERALQNLLPLYQERPGYCFNAPKILNIPLNRVQDEVENVSGEISPDFLLKKWNEGFSLDTESLKDFETESVHKEVPVNFVKRIDA